MNMEDKKNHLTNKQIWLLRMLFEELGNKSLNEALQQWEEQNVKTTMGRIQRPTKDTPSNSGEQSIPTDRGSTERLPEPQPLPSRTKRKSRGHE